GRAGVPALIAEVVEARAVLERPAARRVHADGSEQPLRLADVEALLGSGALVLDACRRGLRAGDTWLPLARRPVLFTLARALAEAWPGDVERNALIARAFRTRRPDETHRARLRVEMGRLRVLAKPLAHIEATARGYALFAAGQRDHTGAPNHHEVAVLVPPIDGEQASLLALLADGAAWSTSALALAVDASQRTVQRALAELEAAQRVRSVGRARAQRWLAPPLAGFTTILLLPAALPLA
ncbi:MAG TPA: helix-turn-helix domain-containing protein, partial [Burkholderiaceae bacterium]|nr:helix-turn-helix domain-containing protein [Burkholderiaceae bacterium]